MRPGVLPISLSLSLSLSPSFSPTLSLAPPLSTSHLPFFLCPLPSCHPCLSSPLLTAVPIPRSPVEELAFIEYHNWHHAQVHTHTHTHTFITSSTTPIRCTAQQSI